MAGAHEAVSLEKRKIQIEVGGTWQAVAALHETWLEDKAFPRFVAPPPSNAPPGAEESWLELIHILYDDLYWLLQLPHHKFWSQIIKSKKPVLCLTSFLQEAPPVYCDKIAPKSEKILNKLGKLVFVIYLRLSTSKEDESNFITPRVFGDLLYDNFIFTVPSLLDICAIYGDTNRRQVETIIKDVTSIQPKFLLDFAMAEPHLINVIQNMESLIESDGKNILGLKDVVVHAYDAILTMRMLVEILPVSCDAFSTCQFLSTITSFYTSCLPNLASQSEIQDIVNNLRIESVKLVRKILEYVLNKAVDTKEYAAVELYLSLLSEVMSDGLFIVDYHGLYPVDIDLDIVAEVCPDIDTMKIDYLLEALASHCEIKLPKIEVKKAESNFLNYPSTSSGSNNIPAKTLKGVELLSLISQVQDILPHLGSEFVEECLKHYNYDPEKVISGVLENALPTFLEQTNWNKEKVAIPDNHEADEDLELSHYRAHKGKKKTEHKNLSQLLDDKREINEMRDKFVNLGFAEDDYDDEYDDTYDGQDVAVREPDELEKRRPFVTPRVLEVRHVHEEEEDEEEEESAAVDKRHFVENPEVVRARWEARRAAQQRGPRDVVGRPKGQGQETNVLINRQKKTVNKSASGNHNRRDRASRKRNQGMIPS